MASEKNMEMKEALILLVEDNDDDTLLMQRAFRKTEIANPIRILENGKKAVAYLKGEPPYGDRKRYPLPSLILLDIKLPIMSGFEVLEWLRQQPFLKRIPVVMLTSSKVPEDINRAYDLGANSYLVKPGEFKDLLEISRDIGRYWLSLNIVPEVG